MTAVEQCVPVVFFVLLCSVALTIQPLNESFRYKHSNEIHRAILSCATVCCTLKFGSNLYISA